MIRAIILDDEQHCCSRLRWLTETCKSDINLLGSYTSIPMALQGMRNQQIDVVFLDIRLRDQTGFDFLNQSRDHSFEVIFTTAYEEYTLQALKLSAVDYLLKPVDRADFEASIERLKTRLSRKEKFNNLELLLYNVKQQDHQKKICLPTLEGYIFIDVEQIIRCQADINYTHLYLKKNQKLTVSKSLKYFEELLSDFNFFRIHNSHLINMAHLKKYAKGKGGYVVMTDNSRIEVSTRRKETFLRQF